MPSTYTPRLRLTLPATGELINTWGGTVNTGITELVDVSIAGSATLSTWGGAGVAYTLSNNNGVADEARSMFLLATGSPGEAKNIICPAVTKLYVLRNSVSGGYSVTLKTAAGTGITVSNGKTQVLWCDGTNVVEATTEMTSAYVTFLQAGSGAITRTAQSKLRDTVSVKDFGAVGDGVTDDTTAIQNAINSLTSGGTVYFPNGTYCVSNSISITVNNITLNLSAANIDADGITGPYVGNQPKAVFRPSGSVRGTTTLAAPIAQYATTIDVVSAANIQPNDIIYLRSSGELWYTESVNLITKREINRVKSVVGNTVTLSQPTLFSYDTSSNTVTVESWNTIKNFKAVGGNFYGGGYKLPLGNGIGPGAFYVTYFDNANLSSMYIEGFQNTAVRFEYGANAVIENSTIRGYEDSYNSPIVEGSNSGFYGVWFARVMQGTMSNVAGYRLRHVQDAADSWQIVVDNVRCWNGHRPALGSHSGASDFVYSNCVVRSTLGGIQWRGHSAVVNNCDIDATTNDSAAFYDAEGGAADIPRVYSFSNNKFSANRSAISFNANIKSAIISGGIYYGGVDIGYGVIALGSLDCENLNISGAFIETPTNVGVFATSTTPRTRTSISVQNCTIKGYTSQAVRVNGTVVTDPTLLVVQNNIFVPNGATVDVLGGTYMSNVIYGPNYKIDGLVYSNEHVSSLSANYTLETKDANTTILHPATDNNPRTFTIPANSSVAFPVGTEITFINSRNTVTLAITSDTLVQAGTGSTGSRTLAEDGWARAVKTTATEWLIDGTGLT